MNLTDLINRTPIPQPWTEGDNIPWNDPAFSRRMLREHLTQRHDRASRRTERIDQHVGWIHHHILRGQPAKVLDLGCGPGLYSHRLAQHGHTCVGIDYSPASIAYARTIASQDVLTCTFVGQDIRQADFGTGYSLAMLIFGEFNIFRPSDASLLLQKAYAALKPGGTLLLEPHTFAAIHNMGTAANSWHSAESGLFADDPYLALTEQFWDADRRTATRRHYVIQTDTGNVTRYAQSLQAYSYAEYRSLLAKHGFEGIGYWPSLAGKYDPRAPGLFVITCRKPYRTDT